MTTLFTLRSIRKFYRNNIVLDLEHLDIHQGRCYLLTGQNGAGKSTLLNILLFFRHHFGRYLFRGARG